MEKKDYGECHFFIDLNDERQFQGLVRMAFDYRANETIFMVAEDLKKAYASHIKSLKDIKYFAETGLGVPMNANFHKAEAELKEAFSAAVEPSAVRDK